MESEDPHKKGKPEDGGNRQGWVALKATGVWKGLWLEPKTRAKDHESQGDFWPPGFSDLFLKGHLS